VHVIVTADTAPEQALAERWPALHLEPLSMNERIAISSHYLAEQGGAVDREGVIRVARDAASSNPLFLRTRLEELRMFGSYQHMSERIERYLSASNLDELFDRVLERLEGEYGVRLLGDVLGAIWGARYGLSESDLEQLVGCSRLELAELLSGLEHHLLRGDGLLRFFHDAIRHAAERRYLDEPAKRRELHLRLARFFDEEATAARRADELPWQLQQAGEPELLARCISGVDMVKTLMAEEKEYELLGYWLAADRSADMAAAYREALEQFESDGCDRSELAALSSAVGDFLRLCGLFDEALPFLERAVEIRLATFGEQHADTAASIFQLANLQQHRGQIDGAEQNFRRALAIQENTLGEGHRATARTIDHLAGVFRARGDFDAAEKLYRKALLLIERYSGLKDTYLAVCVNNLAGVLHDKGRYDEAEALYRRALEIWEGTFGAEHPNTAITMNNLATLLYDSGKGEAAEALYPRVIEIWERRLGPHHPMLASVLSNWATLIADAEPETAMPLLKRALDILESAHTGPHPDTAIVIFVLGRVHYFAKNLEEAERYFERAYEMQAALLGAEHVDTAITMSALASVQRDRSKLDEGEILFRKAITIMEHEHGPEHTQVAMMLRGLADLLLRRGDVAEARSVAQRALAILDRKGTEQHQMIDSLKLLLDETARELL
jgi:tetratricopeptide (TPR) repeat protein